MELQRVRHDRATEQQQLLYIYVWVFALYYPKGRACVSMF